MTDLDELLDRQYRADVIRACSRKDLTEAEIPLIFARFHALHDGIRALRWVCRRCGYTNNTNSDRCGECGEPIIRRSR
jgi:hypothetical protein